MHTTSLLSQVSLRHDIICCEARDREFLYVEFIITSGRLRCTLLWKNIVVKF